MATGTSQINTIFQDLLGRPAGSTGLDYWGNEWETVKQNAIAAGSSTEAAEAAATAQVRANVGRSDEAFEYISGTSDLATTAYDAAAAGVPDWFEFHDDNIAIDSSRPGDWAGDVSSTNVGNYLDDLNYLYGGMQGNVIGREGADWWGYQMTQNIQSGLASGLSYADAHANAMDTVRRDIGFNTGHQNYEKYGSIGYGNPIDVTTDSEGNTVDTYLNLSQRAIDEFGILDHTGTKTAQQYEQVPRLNEDGTYVYDEDDRIVYDDGAQINQSNAPFRWEMIEDARFPGGYRIQPVGFNPSTGQSGPTGYPNDDSIYNNPNLTIAAQDFIRSNYINDRNRPTFQQGGLDIPTGLTNVGASNFATGGGMDYRSWAMTPAGRAAIARGDYTIPNQNMYVMPDGNLSPYRPLDHSIADYNLGLGIGDNVDVDLGEGWRTTFKGPPRAYSGGGGAPREPKENGQNAMMMGAGDTNVYIDMGQKSKTAKDQQIKDTSRITAQAPNRKTYQKKTKTQPNVSSLGIPATTTSARYSVPGAT
tara:strand:- start:442 stop:2037 length:1596 start_codon:yes stop_codon:yes gene_type:complete